MMLVAIDVDRCLTLGPKRSGKVLLTPKALMSKYAKSWEG